jgi:hypothetical protein
MDSAVNVLAPQVPDSEWQSHLRTLTEQAPLQPFAPITLDFIDRVSQRILQDQSLRQFPELMAVAYWMRRSSIRKIQQEMLEQMQGRVYQPRGIVLHFAPSNVDTIFIYSWFLSVLAGNSNILRLSARRGDQVSILLASINEVFETEPFKPVRDRTLIVCYEHDTEITQEFSRRCQVRVIWGGDETIRHVRSIPLNPLATELAFADRFSSAVLKSAAVLNASQEDFTELVHHFYNDAFWFDQMACSSPRLVMWIGSPEETIAAQQRFWSGVETHLQEIGYEPLAAVRIRRLATAYYYGSELENVSISEQRTALLTRVALPCINERLREMHCGGGLFLEVSFPALQKITATLTQKDQTLTVYGFSLEELTSLAGSLPRRSVDRVVPVGQALMFTSTWDGTNLLWAFTREVLIVS